MVAALCLKRSRSEEGGKVTEMYNVRVSEIE